MSRSGRTTLDDIQSREQSEFGPNADIREDDWEDVEMDDGGNVPMDDDVVLSAEGGEMDILLDRSGA